MKDNINYESVPNLRQCADWQTFMESLGWKCYRTKSGVLINIYKTLFNTFNFGKIQKPRLLSTDDLIDINKICKDNNVAFMKLEPINNQDTEIIYKAGFTDSKVPLSPTMTSFIDLTKSRDDLWNAVSHSGKYGVNRAVREETEIKYYKNPNDSLLADFYKIHLDTSKRNKFMTRGYEELKKRRDAFGDSAYLLMAYDSQGDLAGGKYFLGNGEMVLYSHGGTSLSGRSNRSGFSLTWESIVYFSNLGYKIMDFEGMYDPRYPADYKGWEGFTEFKRKFSPIEVEFHGPLIKYYSPLLNTISRFVHIPF